MDRLSDVLGTRLRIACAPCGREGSYSLVRLMGQHGAGFTLEALRTHLTIGCQWRRSPGEKAAGKYEAQCQAKLILPGVKPRGGGSFETFSGALNVYRVDVWQADDSGVAVEVFLCTNLGLARQWFHDVVALYPNELVTLRQKAQVLLSNEQRLPHGTGRW